MARTKAMSPVARRRALMRQESRLRRELDKVVDKLEQCLICDAEKLEKEVRRLEAKHASERDKLAKKLGVDAAELEAKTSKKTSKKSAKKKAAKKVTRSKKVTKKVSKKKTSKKKTSKKKSAKKKASKKKSKESG